MPAPEPADLFCKFLFWNIASGSLSQRDCREAITDDLLQKKKNSLKNASNIDLGR